MAVPPASRTLGLVDPGDGIGGNRVTALRWARILRGLGWHVFREARWSGRDCAALIVIHAERAADSVERWRAERDAKPLVVCAAGTDLYSGTGISPTSLTSFGAADAIVLLQETGLAALPEQLRPRARVIHQSAPPIPPEARDDDRLEALVLAHLRPVKDPLLGSRALRLLPPGSRWHLVLAGALRDEALRPDLEASRSDRRFTWVGGTTRREALRLLSRADLVLSTSRHEGGANVLSEALAANKPVLATDIPGSRGLLGDDHPGLFPVGDADALAALLLRFENEPAFRDALTRATRDRAWIADPGREKMAWGELLDELLPDAEPTTP